MHKSAASLANPHAERPPAFDSVKGGVPYFALMVIVMTTAIKGHS
jgi:hypothetical protein